MLEEKVTIYLREYLKRVARPLTPYEEERRRNGATVTPFDLAPVKELALHLDRELGRPAASDTRKQRLEDVLNPFIVSLLQNAFDQKSRRAAAEKAASEHREEERRQKVREQEHRLIVARIDHFNGLLKHWQRTEERRRFLVELRAAIGPVSADSPLTEWLA